LYNIKTTFSRKLFVIIIMYNNIGGVWSVGWGEGGEQNLGRSGGEGKNSGGSGGGTGLSDRISSFFNRPIMHGRFNCAFCEKKTVC
jgi:hypothetical protein